MSKYFTRLLPLCCLVVLLTACDKGNNGLIEALSNEDERNIANSIHQLILEDENYTILDSDLYPEAYTYLSNHLKDLVLNPLVAHDTNYEWKIFVFDNDDGTNAFTTPGGYIYFDSGLLKFLVSEAEFIGLLSNEIAYADLGLVLQKLENKHGLTLLVDLALNSDFEDSGALLNGLYNEPFTSAKVEQADDYMLALTCSENYDLDQISEFFERAYPNNDWITTHATANMDARISKVSEYNCNNNLMVGDTIYQTGLLDNL